MSVVLANFYERVLKLIVKISPVNSQASRKAIAALNFGAQMKGTSNENQSKKEDHNSRKEDDRKD